MYSNSIAIPFPSIHFFRKALFLFIGLYGLSISLSGQTLTGTINSPERQAIAFTSVIAYQLPDSIKKGGTLTDDNGAFSFTFSEPGTYYLAVAPIGFQSYISAAFALANGQTIDLGTILITEEEVQLDEVEIVAQTSQMELDLDKRVYRVDQDLALAGSSADEILQNLPSVEVDTEGAVSLRGSQNVRILINGKPSGLVGLGGGSGGLEMLQGDMIEKIEVITNPSARYEAEGEAGIINIVLKKERKNGFNGSVNAGTGYPGRHSLGANLNYRSGKVNWFGNLSGNYRTGPGGGGYVQDQFKDGQLLLRTEQDNDRVRSSLGGNFRTGADILFNEYNTLTLSGQLGIDQNKNTTNIVYRDYGPELNLLSTVTRNQLEREPSTNIEFQGTYTKTFPQKDREWVSTIQYQLNDETELADIVETSAVSQTTINQNSRNTEDETNLLIQTDYVHPLTENGKIKFETGARVSVRTIDNDFLVLQENIEGVFEALPGFDNFFQYEENIYAGYGMFSQKSDTWGYQLGMRTEYTDLVARLVDSNDEVAKNYLNWFPSAFVSYQVNATNSFQLSYSRRLSRPRFRNLLPFSGFSDARNLRQGNPDLNPEYTNAMEAGYLAYWDKGSLLSSIYFRRTEGVIERITLFNEEGLSVRIPVNLSRRNALGLELSGSQDLSSWWSVSGNMNIFGQITEGEYEGIEYYAEAISMTSRLNSRMTFPGDIRVQVSGDYSAPRNSPQGRRLARYSMDLGASKSILNGNGTIALSVRDVFNSNRWREITDTGDFYRELDFQWRVRQTSLTFTYRINQEEKRDRGGRRSGSGFDGGDM